MTNAMRQIKNLFKINNIVINKIANFNSCNQHGVQMYTVQN